MCDKECVWYNVLVEIVRERERESVCVFVHAQVCVWWSPLEPLLGYLS
jgi:hypothetical protein